MWHLLWFVFDFLDQKFSFPIFVSLMTSFENSALKLGNQSQNIGEIINSQRTQILSILFQTHPSNAWHVASDADHEPTPSSFESSWPWAQDFRPPSLSVGGEWLNIGETGQRAPGHTWLFWPMHSRIYFLQLSLSQLSFLKLYVPANRIFWSE